MRQGLERKHYVLSLLRGDICASDGLDIVERPSSEWEHMMCVLRSLCKKTIVCHINENWVSNMAFIVEDGIGLDVLQAHPLF